MPNQAGLSSSYKSLNESWYARKALDQFRAGSSAGLEGIRSIIQDSWQRCRVRKINPNLNAAPLILPSEQVQTLREEKTLCEVAAPVLRFLSEALEGHQFLVLLADSQCRILEMVGHPGAVDGAEQINTVPGALCGEEQVGTDALAVSALLNTPVQIHWYEHYCEIGHKWTGNAAPIRHPFSRELVGILSVYGYNDIAHPQALDLAIDAATMIEQRLYEKELVQRLFLFENYNTYQSRYPHDALLGMDAKGTIVMTSPDTQDLLGLSSEKIVGQFFPRLPGLSVPEPFLRQDSDGSPYDLHLHTWAGHLIKATLIPVQKEHSLAGFITVLSPNRTPIKKAQGNTAWVASHTFADIVGESAPLRACIAEARKIAQRELPALIDGESGTGKELFAQAIHNSSQRRGGPFVPLNCGGMSEELLSSELFGYAEGSFTGAIRGGRAGKLELVDGGTLFLDEVEEMSPRMQAHLLRVFEEGRVVRLGAEKPRPIDVRVIAATNVSLEKRVREGQFRQDLYYRLNVLTLTLPPLRERSTDIPFLIQHFFSSQKIPKRASKEALDRLIAYCWPGNVRQLRNVLIQAADRAREDMITAADLPPIICTGSHCPPPCPFSAEEGQSSKRTGMSLQQAEREAILQALGNCKGNVSRAAAQLGLHRVTLYRKMEKHGIHSDWVYR